MLSQTKRFGNLVISWCQNILEEEKEEQFMAYTILLPRRRKFISFQGTNKSLVGFKEDLNMSYKIIPSQIDALNYVNNERGYLF